MITTLTTPYPPTLNTYIRHARGRHYLTERGLAYREAVWIAARKAGSPLYHPGERLRVSIDLYPPDRRRHDIDNRIKAVLDALEEARVLTNDEQVDELRVRRCVPEKPGRAVVRLEVIQESEEAA